MRRTRARAGRGPLDAWRFPNSATPPGASAYYSVRFSAPERRDALAALFAWRGEVCGIVDEISDPGIARLKLDWWRDEAQRTLSGQPRHPLGQLLSTQTAERPLPAEPFQQIAQAVEDRLRQRHSADLDRQRRADEHDLGALFELISHCEGITEERSLALSRWAGGWCAGVRRIRDAGMLARLGREVVPRDRLAAAGLGIETLAATSERQRLPELLRPGADRLHKERPEPTEVAVLPPALRAQVAAHSALLAEIVQSGLAVADQRIALTPLRKLWLAWRASR